MLGRLRTWFCRLHGTVLHVGRAFLEGRGRSVVWCAWRQLHGGFVWSMETQEILKSAPVSAVRKVSQRGIRFHRLTYRSWRWRVVYFSLLKSHDSHETIRGLRVRENLPRVSCWVLAPDKKAICLGFDNSRVWVLKADLWNRQVIKCTIRMVHNNELFSWAMLLKLQGGTTILQLFAAMAKTTLSSSNIDTGRSMNEASTE